MTAAHKPQPRRILVFRIGELGDTLIALPAIRAIHRTFCAARITFLGNATGGTREAVARELLPQGLVDDWRTYAPAGARSGYYRGDALPY